MIFNENGQLMSLNEGVFDKNVSEEVKKIFKDTSEEADAIISKYSGDNGECIIKKKYQNVMLNGFKKMVSACQGKNDYKWVVKKIQWEKRLEEKGKRPSKGYIQNLIKIANGCRLSYMD